MMRKFLAIALLVSSVGVQARFAPADDLKRAAGDTVNSVKTLTETLASSADALVPAICCFVGGQWLLENHIRPNISGIPAAPEGVGSLASFFDYNNYPYIVSCVAAGAAGAALANSVFHMEPAGTWLHDKLPKTMGIIDSVIEKVTLSEVRHHHG